MRALGVGSGNGDGHGTDIGPSGEHAEHRGAVCIFCGGIVAIAASQVIVHRQVGVKNLELTESFNLVEWIEAPACAAAKACASKASSSARMRIASGSLFTKH